MMTVSRLDQYENEGGPLSVIPDFNLHLIQVFKSHLPNQGNLFLLGILFSTRAHEFLCYKIVKLLTM